MPNTITLNMPPEALELIKALTKIAIKAHSNNPGPVEIKLELAALNMPLLLQLNEELNNL